MNVSCIHTYMRVCLSECRDVEFVDMYYETCYCYLHQASLPADSLQWRI